MKVVAVLSMLHWEEGRRARGFRGRRVLGWTVERIGRCAGVERTVVVCWEDQVEGAALVVEGENVFSQGGRRSVGKVAAIAAARRWADGWRGGLLSATCFDQGFDGVVLAEVMKAVEAEALLLVDPEAGLVDPGLLEGLVRHAREHPEASYCFQPAATGLSGLLIKRELLEHLAGHRLHPGQILGYLPDLPGRDPISSGECAPVPTAVAWTVHRFLLDSDRQIERMERATAELNGQLMGTDAEGIVGRMGGVEERRPRELVMELTTSRGTRPIYSVAGRVEVGRGEMSVEMVRRVLGGLRDVDDLRVTFGGVGDGVLHSDFLGVVKAAREVGVRALHVETDLMGEEVETLVDSGVDVVSVMLPAISAEVYAKVMGVDGLEKVLGNLQRLLVKRQARGEGLPLVVPTFVKCGVNLHEMEGWYDHWLRLVGCAVIVGPSDYCGKIGDVAVADMSPPMRVGCRRLNTRMVVLSDGRFVSCEQDVLGEQVVLGWKGVGELRKRHALKQWGEMPLCGSCREWHRS